MKAPIFLALTCAFAAPAMSATFFSNASAFDAATTNAVTTILPNIGSVGLSATAGDLTFTSQSGGLFFGDGANDWSTLMAGNDFGVSGAESFTVAFSSAVTAFSMLVHEPTTNQGRVSDSCNATCFDTTFEMNLLDGATIIDTLTFNPDDDAVTFVGATSMTAFTAVQIVDVTGTIDNEFFNGFTTASIAPVPLPASALLLLGGLGIAGAALRKRAGT
jgi:uncharacterized protein YaiE (UPF0345 family)